MSDVFVRLGVLVLVSLLACFIVWYGRRYVEKRRKTALSALPLEPVSGINGTNIHATEAPVRILAFSSEDCQQCHKFQAPALQRVTEARKYQVNVEEIDAPSFPELTQRYQVLTVPTTVVLDAGGHVEAVNYGFANTQKLLEQVDAVLAAVVS